MLSPVRAEAASSEIHQPRRSPVNHPDSSVSFGQQLASAIQDFLSGSDLPSHFEIAIDTNSGQDSGARQFTVTVKDGSTAPAAARPAAIANPMEGVMMYSGTVEYLPDASQTVEIEAPRVFTDEVDAYWASQPPEIQQLREIRDPEARAAKGEELMNQGFAIDSEIMIWGHDPYMTMKLRQDMGYTWIPSIGQPSIPVAPGLSFPGLPSYDPTNPPPGSIPVSIDFARGLEHTSPWWGGPANNS